MFKIDGAGNVNGSFVNEDAGTNRPPTEVTADWLNAVQNELVNLATDAGLALDKTNSSQVRDAINIMVRKKSGSISSATGSADALIGAYTPAIPALVNGLTLYLRAAYTNATTTPTFTPHAGTIAEKEIVKGNGLAVVAGDIAGAGHWIELQYDLVLDKWVLLNPALGVHLGDVIRHTTAITTLSAVGLQDGALVMAKGYAAAGDGGGGVFRYVAASAQPVDGGTVFAPTAGGGRFFRDGWTVLGFNGLMELKWFGAVGDFAVNDTQSIQAAIDSHVALNAELHVPAGTFKLIPATSVIDESNIGGTFTVLVALTMHSKMRIRADSGAVFKIADNVSTDAAPKSMRMFFSNQFLNTIRMKGLTLDMNGDNNKISPNRAAFVFNRWTQAHILFSGTPGGIAAGANDVEIEACKFINGPGVSCIGMAQSNSVGVTMGSGWTLFKNEFTNNGLDTDDHSSVFGWANGVNAMFNKFENPSPYNSATRTGGLVAFEIHGSDTKFFSNTINNYAQGLWIASNMTDSVRNINVFGNKARVSLTFSDFYSANLSSGASSETNIQGVNIYANEIDITPDAVTEQVKSFFKIAARQQPTMVSIHSNICRSFEVTKNTVLATVIVSPGQLAMADGIQIKDNTAAGVVAGLAVFFSGTGAALDAGSIAYTNNSLGNLIPSPGGLYLNQDVVLYGPSNGRVQSLRLGGLETLVSPVGTDSHAGGRATVYGKALLDLPATWSGITIGNGAYTKKISLDTDSGHATASLGIVAGSTTTYSGNIAPTIGGITADVNGTASATHVKGGAALALPALIFQTSGTVSLYNADGTLFSSAQTTTGSYVVISANIPCRFANI